MKSSLFQLFIGILLLVTLQACSKSKKISEVPTKEGTLPKSFLLAEYQRDAARFFSLPAEREPNIWVKRYDLKGTFDWKKQRFLATVEISFKVLDPQKKRATLDSKLSTIKSVYLKNGQPLGYSLDVEKGLLHVDLSPLESTILLSEQILIISYEVAPSSGRGLRVVPARLGDPVTIPVVYTMSEPRAASVWMPCHEDPSNRAQFSAEFTMNESEMLISNGDLLINEVKDGLRRMKYATRYTIPTYLMAFAVGEFQTATQYHGHLPVSIWARKGTPVDWDGMLSQIVRQIDVFEKLLTPYPFEKYTLVLLPEFIGGIEHAGITFQGEGQTGAKKAGDLSLTAHELAHQWFGDLVTVSGWDDLWIKEGMATLLAEESTRPYEDQSNTGTLFGPRFRVSAGEAVINPSLSPEEKYNSGPYGRAAWVLTQLRSLVGEINFWNTLADILRVHAFGTISTEEFMDAWKPLLGEEGMKRLRQALFAKALPELLVHRNSDKTSLSIELIDSENVLLTPIELRLYESSGSFETTVLKSGKAYTIPTFENKFVVIDPEERHPYYLFFKKTEDFKEVKKLVVPKNSDELRIFLTLRPQFQFISLAQGVGWDFSPAEFTLMLSQLGSEKAKLYAIQRACDLAMVKGKKAEPWKQAILKAFFNPPFLGQQQDSNLSNCQSVIPKEFLDMQWSEIEANPAATNVSLARLEFLGTFAAKPQVALRTWGALGQSGTSVQARMIGVSQLIKHLNGTKSYLAPSEEDKPQWKQYFRKILATSEVQEILLWTVTGAAVLKDIQALPYIAAGVKKYHMYHIQKMGVCFGYAIAKDDPPSWKAFVEELGDLSKFSPQLREVIEHPAEKCVRTGRH